MVVEDLLIKYYDDINELVDANIKMCKEINANTRKIQSYMYRIRDIKNKMSYEKPIKHALTKPKKDLMSEESFWEDILNM